MEMTSKQYYKKYSYLFTRIKKRSKSLHYQDALNNVKHYLCGIWRMIKKLLAASLKRLLNHFISLLEAYGENFSLKIMLTLAKTYQRR